MIIITFISSEKSQIKYFFILNDDPWAIPICLIFDGGTVTTTLLFRINTCDQQQQGFIIINPSLLG